MQIRIYYEDTDVGGIVYHSNYINYCERARSEAFFQAGKKLGSNNVHFVVKKIEASYIKPAVLGDLLDVKTSLIELKNASVYVLQEIFRGETKLFEAKILLANVKDGKPTKMSEDDKEFFINKLK
ncbi:MAG: YbgC/FadM family acyl-CoA thioesterase [Campylobacteraceae bacterium]